MGLRDNLEKFKRWMVSSFPHIGSGGSSKNHPLYLLFKSVQEELDKIWSAIYELRGKEPPENSLRAIDVMSLTDEQLTELESLFDKVLELDRALIDQDKRIQELTQEIIEHKREIHRHEKKFDNLLDLIVGGTENGKQSK